MPTKNSLADELQTIDTLGIIVETYQEISVMKIQKIRLSVLQSRLFLDELSQVFQNVKESYRKQVLSLVKKNRHQSINGHSVITKNGKTVSVLISPNNKLYGNVVFEVFDFFRQETADLNDDIVLVGKTALDLYQQLPHHHPFKYFEMNDNLPRDEEVRALAEYLVVYQKINMFHGKFNNLVTQQPIVSNITGNDKMSDDQILSTPPTHYIFEPSLENILQFFESQVFSSLFKQTISESQLASHASRIKYMEDSLNHIAQQKNLLTLRHRRFTQNETSKKQLEMISGISLWN